VRVPDFPLSGIRVLEMSQIIAAPYCGQMLGDMGAEVIKIEVPQGGDVSRSYGPYRFGDPADGVGHGLSYYFCAFNRNKQSVTLNLRLEGAKDALRELIKRSDVFLHNSLAASIERQLAGMPRRDVIRASLAGRGALIKVRDLDEACALVNRVAPEHLELSVAEPRVLLSRIRHAGAIFLGRYASEALGDYCAGPNHVLPTSRTARFSSPLGVYDFQKRSSVIRISRKGAARLGRVAAELARGEGLTAHAMSAEYRMKQIEPPRRRDAKKSTSR